MPFTSCRRPASGLFTSRWRIIEAASCGEANVPDVRVIARRHRHAGATPGAFLPLFQLLP
jgi:hypothetical protein